MLPFIFTGQQYVYYNIIYISMGLIYMLGAWLVGVTWGVVRFSFFFVSSLSHACNNSVLYVENNVLFKP